MCIIINAHVWPSTTDKIAFLTNSLPSLHPQQLFMSSNERKFVNQLEEEVVSVKNSNVQTSSSEHISQEDT